MENSTNHNTTIVVACHKQDDAIRSDGVYMPIHVGKALHPEIDLSIQGDNTGQNISIKNGSYCELTAMYWAWKNLKDYDYIGLAHYRRYLDFDVERIPATLEKYDWILPKPFHCQTTNYVNLALLLTHEDAIIAIDILLKTFPEAEKIIQHYFFQSNLYSVFNMFITDRKHFNEYCSFLFPYLEKVEAALSDSGYSRLKRNIGYIAEAVLGLWIEMKGARVKYVGTEDLSNSNFKDNLRTRLRNFQRDLGFRLAYLPRRQYINYYSAAASALKNAGLELEQY